MELVKAYMKVDIIVGFSYVLEGGLKAAEVSLVYQ